MRKTISVVVVAALAVGLVFAQQADAAERVQPLIRSGELVGAVTNAGGEALEGIAVQLIDGNEKVAVRAVTDEEGAFKTAQVSQGDYTLAVGENLKYAVSVSDDGTITKLLIVAPDAPAYAAAQLVGPGIGTGAAAAIGGGVVVLGGAVAVQQATRESGDDRVSP